MALRYGGKKALPLSANYFSRGGRRVLMPTAIITLSRFRTDEMVRIACLPHSVGMRNFQ